MIKKLLLILCPVVLMAGNLALIEWYAPPSMYDQRWAEFFAAPGIYLDPGYQKLPSGAIRFYHAPPTPGQLLTVNQIWSEFFDGYTFWPYTVFVLVTLTLALWYWLRKPGPVSLAMIALVVFGLCGIPGIHWKNTLIWGPSGGKTMRTWLECEAKMYEAGAGQGLPLYINWKQEWRKLASEQPVPPYFKE